MKLFGYEIKKANADNLFTNPQITNALPQGWMTGYFNNFALRKVSGEFYEALREGIPIIDAGIRRLISLNGTIKIIGDNQKIVSVLEEFCLNVPVNDTQKGIHAFLENASNETFEQGFALAEFVATPDLKDIAGLKVADSKNIVYRRNQAGVAEPWYRYPSIRPMGIYSMPGTLIDRIINATYGQVLNINGINEVKLDPSNKLYFSINNENSDPYGVSIMRSMEFVAQVLVTIQNSMKNVFERFGDPSYHVHYKSSKVGSGDNLEARRGALTTDWNNVINAKRQGKSADLVTAGSSDTDVSINIIGANGQVLQYDIPTKHVEGQVLSKFNLPAWMLLPLSQTVSRNGSVEVEGALQDAKIRQLAMLPEFIRLFSTYLKIRGFKWNTVTTNMDKSGDWGIVFETPNVRDMVAQAQARFLNAQADQMQHMAGTGQTQTNVTIGGASMDIEGMRFDFQGARGKGQGARDVKINNTPHTKELLRPIPWPEMDKIETDYENELKFDWQELQCKVLSILGLDKQKAAEETETKGFGDIPPISESSFTAEQRQAIFKALENYLGYYDPTDPNSAVRWAYSQAYSLGLIQAAKLIGEARPILDIIKNKEVFDELARHGFQLVTDNATRAIVDEIIPAMEAMMRNGENPVNVASKLNSLFGDQNSDWERLARSEMAIASEQAKLDEWQAWDVQRVEFSPSPDACALCFSVAGDYEIGSAPVPVRDTHPRCRCALIPAKPTVGA